MGYHIFLTMVLRAACLRRARSSANNCGFGKWTKTWQLLFNGEKCESMRITQSREKSTTDDSLGAALKDVEDFMDLEVIISKDLTWSEHISTIVI